MVAACPTVNAWIQVRAGNALSRHRIETVGSDAPVGGTPLCFFSERIKFSLKNE
jgi:hypothetical protein